MRTTPQRFHQVLDLIADGLDGLWDAVADSYLFEPAGLAEVVDHLGLATVSSVWHESSRRAPGALWPVALALSIEEWADEGGHRQFLMQLIEDADEETIWHAAAGPLEDFITDDEERLQWVEVQSRRDAKFRLALSGVWSTSKSREAAQRIARAVG